MQNEKLIQNVVNPYHLKKAELLIYATGYCKHRMPYKQHPKCFLEEVMHNGKSPKIGFLDLEFQNFKANYGILLTYAIKEYGKKEVLSSKITTDEIRSKYLDKELTRRLIKDFSKFDVVVTYYGCFTPNHKILTSDLIWKNVQDIKIGDKLVGFDEFPERKGSKRWFKEVEVLHNISLERNVAEIKLSDGTKLTTTLNHPFLVKRGGTWVWRKTSELMHFNGKNEIQRIMPTWENKKDYNEGYVSAFLDGEGHISQVERKGRNDTTFSISFCQSDNQILKRLCKCLDEMKFSYSVRPYDKTKPHVRILNVLGKKQDKVKLLGLIDSEKGKYQFNVNKLNGVTEYETLKIESIKLLGKKTICALGTTGKTYITEGFGCHNSKCDIPYMRTRALKWKLKFPSYGYIKHIDMYYIVKAKLSLNRNSLQSACALLGIKGKNHVFGDIWIRAVTGNQKSIDYIHDHNIRDVVILERLYNRMITFSSKTNRSI